MDSFKDKMMEKIKQYSNQQYLDGYIRKEFLTVDGDADIFLNITEKNELFDTWTVGDQVDLESDVYDFIEEKTSMLGNDIQIKLNITGCEFTPREQGIIKHVLKEHYAIELYKVQKEYVKYRNKIIFLIAVGVSSFLIYTLLFFFTNQDFFIEVFGFLFSFALWEALDALIYSFSEVKSEREAVTQNLLMNVEFYPEYNNDII